MNCNHSMVYHSCDSENHRWFCGVCGSEFLPVPTKPKEIDIVKVMVEEECSHPKDVFCGKCSHAVGIGDHVPERDYYTKAEIDRMVQIIIGMDGFDSLQNRLRDRE